MRPSRRLPHQTWQSGFAIAAVAAALALPVVLLSVGGGVSDHVLYELEHAGFEIAVSAPGLHGIANAHNLSLRIDGIPGVASASPILAASVDAFGPSTGAIPALAEGVIPKEFEATESANERPLFPHPLPLGDPTDAVLFSSGSYRGTASDDVLVSSPFAASLGVSVGQTLLISPASDRSTAVRFQVTGVVAMASQGVGPTAAYALVLPLSDLQLLTGVARTNGTSGPLVDGADTVQVHLSGGGSTDPRAVAMIASKIRALVPYYGVSTLSDQARSAQQAAAVLTGFYLGLSSIGLSIGLVFLGLVLVRRVEAERRYIGIRRAIGMPGRQIAGLMARRGLALAASGTAGGVLGGWVIVALFEAYGSPSVRAAVSLAVFDPITILALALGFLALSLLAGAVATRAALRLSIPEALR